ncbi:metallophosphoesterase family protein [Thalassoglobus sp.]|uniref:metallophosphoesterase family protein n=1 Tax=Thalassoglobus sp. TaxID=2795869 RepID=UPI003AA81C35
MATFAIGDIHGCWNALETLLEQVPIQEDDLIITLGDYVDRGPESARVLDWVMDQTANERFIALRGNHELMMLAASEGQMNPQHWLACGGKETLTSYQQTSQRRIPNIEDISPQHLNFIKYDLRPYYETDTHIFVHAYVYEDAALEDQDELTLYWERFDLIRPHKSGKVVICGHTAQRSGLPANRQHAVCIDTWVYGDGWLTCLDVESGQYWQANQKRKHRSNWLEL